MRRSIPVRHPSAPNPREALLEAVFDFVLALQACPGVARIALVVRWRRPSRSDADVLVTLEDDEDLEPITTISRRLKGRVQGMNLGADIFLCLRDGRYVGRVCRYRECHHRAPCEARRCGGRNHLNDDLHIVMLDKSLTLAPPFLLWPKVERRAEAPEDVERLLLARLEAG